jgi:DNA invertase Pin-like site-specific DNA recombinase
MILGYARVSTTDQDLALQRDALTAAGCERIFTDTMTGTSTERPVCMAVTNQAIGASAFR